MIREKFVPVTGRRYQLHSNSVFVSEFVCMLVNAGDSAVFQNVNSGWTFTAHGLGIYNDLTIDWDYSTGGRFL